MREKVIDTALIVTLILVAFGITWTLLTLNRGTDRPVSVAAETEQTTQSQGTGTRIEPLPLGGDAPAAENGRPAEASESDPRLQSESAESAESEPQPVDQAEVPEPEPVPPGAVQLERVGFSFVTGGAGACGIVLEPWQHVAVSRELLAAYGCGAEVTLTLEEEKAGRTQFQAVIADTMNPVHSRTVNIYVGEDEPALQYGVTSGVLRP